ncbi:hypothetical protein HDU99_006507, partial [Rhizoclosmatium hyalinum]
MTVQLNITTDIDPSTKKPIIVIGKVIFTCPGNNYPGGVSEATFTSATLTSQQELYCSAGSCGGATPR